MSDKRSRTISYATKSVPGGIAASCKPGGTTRTAGIPKTSTSWNRPSVQAGCRPTALSQSGASTSQVKQKLPSPSEAPANKPSISSPKPPPPVTVYRYNHGTSVKHKAPKTPSSISDERNGAPKVIFVPADQCVTTSQAIKTATIIKQRAAQTSKKHPVKRLAQSSKPVNSKKVQKAPVKTSKAPLKMCKAPLKKTKESKVEDMLNEDPNVFNVDKVINKRVENGKIYYRIRWQGYVDRMTIIALTL
ncbi:hypothetical protein RvY_05676-2 [Ramazzottius varieornatus]|uniref:Chromo domain-containing protein n=1 Tax=Ramazzottius varieornatus TaxID=947166 RepID=A0A1D1UWE6_RAMVA|nr:hypothetical protein RvY_05676-2 [Ramazzottius varieornatus]